MVNTTGSGGGGSNSCGRRVRVVRLGFRPAAAVGVQRTEAAIHLVEALNICMEALILGVRKDSECHEGVQRPPSLLAESVTTWEVWVEPWSLQRALRHKATQPSGRRNR